MCIDLDTIRARLRTLKRLSLVIGVLLVMIAMLFFWTGFSVPDWLELKMSQEAMEKKFGLWLVCSINVKGSVLTCRYWATSNEFFPGKFVRFNSFFRTSEVYFMVCGLRFPQNYSSSYHAWLYFGYIFAWFRSSCFLFTRPN